MDNKKIIKYGWISVIAIMVLTIGGMAISSKTVSKKELKETLVGNQIGRYNYGFNIENTDQIVGTKYLLSKSINKEKDRLYLPVELKLRNQYIEGKAILDFDYQKNDEEWTLNNYNIQNIELEVIGEINSEEMTDMLGNSNIYFFKHKRGFEKSDIESINIKEINTLENQLAQQADIALILNDKTSKVEISMKATFVFGNGGNGSDYGWYVDGYDFIEYKNTVVGGVNDSLVKNSLVENRIYAPSDNYNENYFRVDDISQISKLTIVNSNTKLEEKTDEVEVNIEVKKENIQLSGSLILIYRYYDDRGWALRDINTKNGAKFTVKMIKEFNVDIDKIKSDLIGQEISYYSGWYNTKRWTISSDNMKNVKFIESSYGDEGKQIDVLCEITLEDDDSIVYGNVTISYALENNSWTLQQTQRNGSFKELDRDEYYSSMVASGNYPQIEIANAQASSVRAPIDQFSYGAQNIIDNDLETAWVDGKDDEGHGEWIELDLSAPSEVALLEIFSGYQKTSSLYRQNHRPRTIEIRYDDTNTIEYELLDKYAANYIKLDTPINTDKIRITIKDTYGGNDDKDTCISEIKVYKLN